jgi:hypothetical protein
MNDQANLEHVLKRIVLRPEHGLHQSKSANVVVAVIGFHSQMGAIYPSPLSPLTIAIFGQAMRQP